MPSHSTHLGHLAKYSQGSNKSMLRFYFVLAFNSFERLLIPFFF